MAIVALIPARAGSKGVKNKNLQTIAGRTLVEIAIELAKQTNKFDRIIVSSDSDEILQIATRLGVSALRRPDYHSGDDARASDVVNHVISESPQTFSEEDLFVYLQPTSPFCSSETVQRIIEHCLESDEPSFSAAKNRVPINKTFSVCENGKAVPFLANSDPTANRQKSAITFHATGACYAFKLRHFNYVGDIPVFGAYAYIVNELESLDIDSDLDLRITRLLASEGINL
jgi:CMP-N-acetylneuraminic acid synthetase